MQGCIFVKFPTQIVLVHYDCLLITWQKPLKHQPLIPRKMHRLVARYVEVHVLTRF